MTLHGGRVLAVLVGSSQAVGLTFWVAITAAVLGLEVTARLTRSAVPSLGDLVARYLPDPLLRAAGVALWLFAGWHLFSH
ncbi:MAG TPA: DUF6186 family protein [Acidimicrobiia bacterium]|nr:DUF6186 family protein [Acidimicrobiia bacterium]